MKNTNQLSIFQTPHICVPQQTNKQDNPAQIIVQILENHNSISKNHYLEAIKYAKNQSFNTAKLIKEVINLREWFKINNCLSYTNSNKKAVENCTTLLIKLYKNK